MKFSRFCQVLVLLVATISMASCEKNKIEQKGDRAMVYKVEKANSDFNFSNGWQQGQWSKIEALKLTNYMGEKPEHFPQAQAKVLYDDKNIYVFFKVDDQYVRSVAKAHHGNVWEDSCVEFFFTPSEDVSQGYFNVEANCGGLILMRHQIVEGKDTQEVAVSDINKMTIEHSMPKIVDPEITEPAVWTLKYALPFEVIEKYTSLVKPDTGVKWKANFFKCADYSSHPHWLTWSVVERPQPQFHLPEYFGTLQFD